MQTSTPTQPFTFVNRKKEPQPVQGPTAEPKATLHAVPAASPSALARRRAPLTARPPLHKRPTSWTEHRGVSILNRVVDIASTHGYTLDEIADAYTDPTDTWPGRRDGLVVRLRDRIAVIVDTEFDEIIGIADSTEANRERSQPRDGAIKQAKGCGMGSRFPTSIPDLIDRLRKAGFGDIHFNGGDHYVATHLATGTTVTFSQTPSDVRAIPKAVLQIRRITGVDLREAA